MASRFAPPSRPADPPEASTPRGTTTRRVLAGFAFLLSIAGTALLVWYDPAEVTWLPKCPVHELTGWHCPGCGLTRAAHALLHGDLGGALAKNPFLVIVGPLLLGYGLWMRSREGRDWSQKVPGRAILGLLAAVVLFAVLRNLPWYPFHLLAPH